MSFDKRAYDSQYHKAAYDSILFQFQKGKKAELKALAEEKGMSVNRLIIEAIAKTYGLWLGKPNPKP